MLIVEVAPVDRTSEATGLSSVVRYLFTAVGSQLIAFLLAQTSVSDASQGRGAYPGPSAYALTLGFIALMSLLSVAIMLALPRRGGAVQERQQPAQTEARVIQHRIARKISARNLSPSSSGYAGSDSFHESRNGQLGV